MNRWRFLFYWFFLEFGLLAATPGPELLGQLRQPTRPADQLTNVFLPAPRSLRQQLGQAREAIEQERFGDAVDRLGRLLADPQQAEAMADESLAQDYFLSPTGEPGTQVSLKSQVRELLGSMPAKGRELYELKFGADARQLLVEAVAQSDVQQLLEVTRRYFHTQAGYEATVLLGRFYLDQGQPLAAALAFQRLASLPDRSDYDNPQLSLLLATSWYLAEMPEKARETLQDLKTRVPTATVRVGDVEMDLFERDDQALAWLEELIGAGFGKTAWAADQWVMFRGDPARNAKSRGGCPLEQARWRVRTANHPTDEQLIQQRRQQYRDQGVPALPSFQPLAVSDVVLMRTPRRLIAVDLETGKRIWDFPWFDSPDEKSLYQDRVRPEQRAQNARAMELDQRVWDDSAFGQMSSDGRQVFVLWELGHATTSGSRMQIIVRPQPAGQNRSEMGPTRFNKLAALDLEQEGKLQWIVGGEDGTDEPKCAGFFFLGVPLPLMDQLFVMAEVNSELRLVVLDKQTGRLEWSQQLAHVDTRDITQDSLRRLAGASPSFSDGVLVCPTSAGAIVAVDTVTRSLLWGYQYPQSRRGISQNRGIYPAVQTATGDRWADATATIAEGRVLLTPVESDSLHCVNLLTGELCWPPRPRNGLLYTAGIHQGQAVMVGHDRIETISLADGETIWTLALPDGMPSGRGIISDNSFFLPVTTGHLLKISLVDGTILRRHKTNQVLGNLVAYQDQILSHGADWLAAYYQAEPLRHTVAERLAADADNIWALARQAELHLHDGDRTAALKVLQHAYRIAPRDDSVRSLLVTSLLSALRDDFANYRQYAGDLQALIDQPARQAEYYRLMAIGMRDVQEYDQALEFFVKLASLEPTTNHGNLPTGANLLRVSPQLRVRHDRWIKTQLAKMFTSADGPARKRIDRTIQEHLADVLASGSVGRLRRFVDQFGEHVSGEQARFELADMLVQHNALLEAELLLVDLHSSSDTKVAGRATAMLAQLLQRVGRLSDAAHYYRQLGERWSDMEVLDDLSGSDLLAQAGQERVMQAALATTNAWPYGKRLVEKTDSAPRQFRKYVRVYPIQMKQKMGPYLENHRVAYDQSMNAITMRDHFGETTRQVLLGDRSRFYSTNYSTSRVSVKGHLLLLAIGYEVLALDTLRSSAEQDEAILWRKDLSSSMGDTSMGQRRLMTQAVNRDWGPTRHVPIERTRQPIGLVGPITRNGVFYQKAQELTCADVVTGEAIWVRGGLEPGSDIFGDDQFLFVVGPTANEAIVLNAADGTELDRRPVPARSDRWFTRDRHILTCRIQEDQLQIQLFDTWDQRHAWQHGFAPDSQCWRVDHDEIAIMEPSGRLVILHIDDGQAIIDTQLEPEPELARLFVLPSRSDYVVVASSQRDNTSTSSSSGERVFGPLGIDHCRLVSGHIYALDRQSGESLWAGPASINDFSLPLDQPAEIPALVLLRHITTRSLGQSSSSNTTASLLCLDRRDGRQIVREDEMPALRSYSVVGHPTENRVQIMTNSVGFDVTFTDESVPAEPPLQMQEPISARKTFEKVRDSIAETVLEALIKRKSDQAPEKEEKEKAPPNEARPDQNTRDQPTMAPKE